MKSDHYIAFDVETPNAANDRMSAIGITVIDAGSVIHEFYSLVDPETHFDRFNIALTGISPRSVAGQPTFPALWQHICPIMEDGVLVAHNAPFDLSVLSKCLRAYGIDWQPTVSYVCTCQMSRKLLPQLCNHRLNTLCDYLELQLEHHHAGSDSRACGEILLHHLRSGADITPFLRTYDLLEARTCGRARPFGRRI